MGESLSQAEIEALLNGALSPDEGEDAGNGDAQASAASDVGAVEAMFASGEDPNGLFTHEEIDALGEIGNISMGNSATTLFTLLNRKVNITTPTVTVSTMARIADSYSAPLVVVRVEYTEGLTGTNLLVLKESDVMAITDLMMGGDGTNTSGEITELHLSAISEAMNQMIGNASTSLSGVFDMKIDISPPTAVSIKEGDSETLRNAMLSPDEQVAVVLFDMTVEGILDTKIMQMQPFEFAQRTVRQLIEKNKPKPGGIDPAARAAGAAGGAQAPGMAAAQSSAQAGGSPYGAPPQMQQAGPYGAGQGQMPYGAMPDPAAAYAQQMGTGMPPMGPYGAPPQHYPQQPAQYPGMPGQMPYGAPPPYGAPGQQYGAPPYGAPHAYVNVQPATFQPLDDDTLVFDRKNIGLVMDVQLEVSVELGRTRKLIKDILEFGQGSIIELDKLAGEPVDILVNNKTIAKGEVVVIDESFGVRVVDIIHPSKRLA